MFGHAIGAAKIAAVRHRDAEVGDWTGEGIYQRSHGVNLGPRGLGGKRKAGLLWQAPAPDRDVPLADGGAFLAPRQGVECPVVLICTSGTRGGRRRAERRVRRPMTATDRIMGRELRGHIAARAAMPPAGIFWTKWKVQRYFPASFRAKGFRRSA